MSSEKKVTDFHQGDRVEFICRGYVTRVMPLSVHVKLDGLHYISDMAVPPGTLTNLSDAREMSAEEAKKLLDDEL